MEHGPRLIILGRQGAGKGTQCALLSERLGIPHVSTGDVLRAEVAAGTELGSEVGSYLRGGSLVPDSLMLDLVARRIGTPEAQDTGYLLDGFPRTLAQVRALLDLLGRDVVDLAVEIHVPSDVVRPRLAARRVCRGCGLVTTATSGDDTTTACPNCGGVLARRDDDTDAAIERRLALYDEKTGPLLVWLDSQGLLVTVDGAGAPAEVLSRLVEVVGSGAGAAPAGSVIRPGLLRTR
jgi:adenylate kinase